MTEHGHNFIREIAEAYRALEAESGLHAQIDLMAKERIRDGETIARLEMRIMELKALEDDLLTKVRSLEVERDDAGFRFLESEDRLDAIRRAIGMPEAIASAVAKATEKVEPLVEAKPAESTWTSTDEYGATTIHSEPNRIEGEPNYVPGSFSNPLPGTEPTGQSEADPIASTTQATQSPSASSATVPIQEGASSIASEPVKPYSGKRYVDHAYYVSLSGWLAGGGTEEDYDWRPDTNPIAAIGF
jgi:hypothetical protein